MKVKDILTPKDIERLLAKYVWVAKYREMVDISGCKEMRARIIYEGIKEKCLGD